MESFLRHDDEERRLLQHVHPPDWRNPTPKSVYDLVVIGGGTAGLVCAAGAAGLGARVALIERSRLGGDCLNTGCVPSKALLRSARAVGAARAAAGVGVHSEARADFHAVMARMRARRADIAPNDSAARLASLGVDVFFGHAWFTGRRTIEVRGNARNARSSTNAANDPHVLNGPNEPNGPNDPNVLRFRKAVIATGSRPAIPPIDGLDSIRFFTNETIFDITEQPRRLAIIGGGPVGCEMAQAFARLGTHVALIESAAQLLPHEDADAAAIVATVLAADGVEVRTNSRVASASPNGAAIRLVLEGADVDADALLVATGRLPNVDDLGLTAAGVMTDTDGIRVSDELRTTNRRIYASGDVASRYKFTHAADALSRLVVQNALFFGRKRAAALVIPWCTFTDPELAHVGITATKAAEQRLGTITIPLREVDRAVVDEEVAGFVRIHHRAGRLAGATVVGPGAGELISIVAYAMQRGDRLSHFSAAIFPYPTLSLALRQAGDAFQRTRLTPGLKKLLQYYFQWR